MLYIRWKIAEDRWKCFLVCTKTKVAPKNTATVPRMELMAAQLGVRMTNTCIKAMEDFTFQPTIFLTDSTAVFGMLNAPNGSLSIFSGHRISEIKAASENAKWLWVTTHENIADLGTRGNAKPVELERGTVYQDGPTWLQESEDCWPIKSDIHGSVPPAETKKLKLSLAVTATERNWFPVENYSSLKKAKNVMCYILGLVDRLLARCGRPHGQPLPI